ncbi:uncharacterized protein [Clytia hemisphaerica]|uniref:Uncharacterized protein n=1 Tax=Clytia hemisphaerica TaxID=252671 RepID=A0A7M5WR52_9CNID
MRIQLMFLSIYAISITRCLAQTQQNGHSEIFDVIDDSSPTEEGQRKDVITKKRATSKEKLVGFTDILKSSLDMITSRNEDPVPVRQFLNKHFFTNDKDMSIWSKAIDEAEQLFHVKFTERDLADMQGFLRDTYQYMLTCDDNLRESKRKSLDLKKHVQCYVEIYNVVQSGKLFFGLPADTDIGKTRILSLNMAYSMMKMLYLQMSKLLSAKADLNPLVIAKPMLDTSVRLVNHYNRIGDAVNASILSGVSAVKTCVRETIFFREFNDHCSPVVNMQDALTISGGSTRSLFDHKYRVTVTDESTGDTVCELIKQSPTDAELSKMKKDCGDKRNKHINKLMQKMSSYLKDRTEVVTESLQKLWGKNKKKLKIIASSYVDDSAIDMFQK